MRHRWINFLSVVVVFLFLVNSSAFAQTTPYTSMSSGSSAQAQPNFQGSVTSGAAPGEPLRLSLDDALQRGLRYNLGTITSREDLRQAHGESIVARSQLLPNLNGGLLETVQQIDLAAFGFKFSVPPGSGFSIPTIVGPFNYFDLRANLTQKLADVQALRSYQSTREAQKAVEFSAADTREMVVYFVTASYLQVLDEAARVESAKVQLSSAQTIAQQASDRFNAGLAAKIDMTRSQVEMQTQQQRLTTEETQYEKQKITLDRLIGLPSGQQLILTDALPYAPLENVTLEQAIVLASQNRSDLKAAEARMHAAELTRKSASAERYPTLGMSADYGVIGINPANSHGTFSLNGQLRFPIWQGGRIRGDIDQADALLARRRADYDNMRARVETEVRVAFLDLSAAVDQVRVAQDRRGLAQDVLTQARDRFASGVADTIEVVQAQEAVSSAEQEYIASLTAHNLAKASVARATGQAEKITRELLRSK